MQSLARMLVVAVTSAVFMGCLGVMHPSTTERHFGETDSLWITHDAPHRVFRIDDPPARLPGASEPLATSNLDRSNLLEFWGPPSRSSGHAEDGMLLYPQRGVRWGMLLLVVVPLPYPALGHVDSSYAFQVEDGRIVGVIERSTEYDGAVCSILPIRIMDPRGGGSMFCDPDW